MRHPLLLLALGLAAGSLHAQSAARGPTGQVVYPAREQSARQAEQDRFECHEWARQQSGFDPTQAVPATAAAPAPTTAAGTSPGGAMVQGAAGGAAVAELADRDAGKGAAAGLIGAALRQRMQQPQREAASAEQQRAMQQQAARAQQRGTYERGFGACMEARGYIVK